MLHVCTELWCELIHPWVLAFGENCQKNSGTEKKQLLCARTKLDKMLVVTLGVVCAPLFFILLSVVLQPAYQDLEEFAIRS